MTWKLLATAGLTLTFALLIPACAGKAPKQAEAPDVLTDKGSDMSHGEDSRNGQILKTDDKSGEDQMHVKCCGQCKEGLAGDRTGAAPNTIPCTDFSDKVDAICREHFLAKKTMASDCK